MAEKQFVVTIDDEGVTADELREMLVGDAEDFLHPEDLLSVELLSQDEEEQHQIEDKIEMQNEIDSHKDDE